MTDDDLDRFRWCKWCGADCEGEEPTHTAECPSSTGIYPVEPHKHCEMCTCDGSILCGDCDALLKVGDFYMLREVSRAEPLLPGLEGVAVYEVICIGCAAGDAIAGA